MLRMEKLCQKPTVGKRQHAPRLRILRVPSPRPTGLEIPIDEVLTVPRPERLCIRPLLRGEVRVRGKELHGFHLGLLTRPSCARQAARIRCDPGSTLCRQTVD
jgi:hypothetical protein